MILDSDGFHPGRLAASATAVSDILRARRQESMNVEINGFWKEALGNFNLGFAYQRFAVTGGAKIRVK
jgi:hypothetical protein